jgi:multidrug efflux pump subunit AcrA (membrane-fusion protein)
MDKQQKKRIKQYLAWAMLLCLVAVLTVLPVIAGRDAQETGPQASVLKATPEYRSISQSILGGGTLTAGKPLEITVPAGVKVTEYLVNNGDMVAQGQSVAKVDRVSIMTAITKVQETLDYLAEEMEAISGNREATKITAPAEGTVKVLYGQPGQQVQDVLLDHGTLAVLSLDGLMAVRIPCESTLSGGDGVCVTLEDGTQVAGRVKSNLEGILTVTVSDNNYPAGAEVTVSTEEGKAVGTGKLEIHSPWNVVAYSGVIAQIHVKEGDAVSAGKLLLTLENTDHSARFESLSRQRREYETWMLELFQMYQSETVTAPGAGMVTGVDTKGAYMLSWDSSYQVQLLANAPDGNEEATYVNFVGQVSELGQDGLVMNMNPQPLFITDYLDLSEVPMDPELMCVSQVYRGDAPMYALEAGEWVQMEAADIQAGDILLFAGDMAGNFVWVVRVQTKTETPEVPETTAPTEPEEPTDSREPETPEEETPTIPEMPNLPGGYPQMPGGYPGMGRLPQEEQFELYSLDTFTIANVIPQETMTVSVSVDELDIAGIFPGQSVSLTVDALEGEMFSGTVTGISATGISIGGNSKFQVEVTVGKIPDMLPGMTAHVSAVLRTVENAFCIPVAALAEQGSESIVYTGYDEKTETFVDPLPVTVGLSDGEYAQILSGLGEGQVIYYPYYDTLVISNVPDSGITPFG